MQLLCDARAFAEPLFESHTELLGNLPQAQTINGQNDQSTSCDESKPKPPRLPEGRLHFKRDCGLAAVPHAIRVARDEVESVRAWAEIGVYGFAARHRSRPITVEAVELEPIADPIRSRQIQADEIESDALAAGRNANGGSDGNRQVIR